MITTREFVSQHSFIDEATSQIVENEIQRIINRHLKESQIAAQRPGRVFIIEDKVELDRLREEPTVAVLDDHKPLEQFEEIRSNHEIVIVMWSKGDQTQDMLGEAGIPYQIMYAGRSMRNDELREVAQKHGARGCSVGAGIAVDLLLLRGLI